MVALKGLGRVETREKGGRDLGSGQSRRRSSLASSLARS